MKYVTLGLKILLTVGLLATASAKLTQQAPILESFDRLGYPAYLTYILGVCYLLAVVGIWQPASAMLKQWAFAGLFFALAGAVLSHVFTGDPIQVTAAALVFLVLIVIVAILDLRSAP
ncbi:MAG: DoxX family protein [Pseudomonadota bacterium]